MLVPKLILQFCLGFKWGNSNSEGVCSFNSRSAEIRMESFGPRAGEAVKIPSVL